TVIMTSINQAYAAPGSLLDLFLESFRVGEGTAHLLDHVLIVAVDPGALRRCRSVHRHCYLLRRSPGAVDYSGEKHFMTKDYLDMMWGRNRFQQTILELGFNFLFTVRERTTVHVYGPPVQSTNHVLGVWCFRTSTSCGSGTRCGTSPSRRTWRSRATSSTGTRRAWGTGPTAGSCTCGRRTGRWSSTGGGGARGAGSRRGPTSRRSWGGRRGS
uniref:Nucleotide-diphospho-sugar transferase domain-containing protein n=1 Tax=Aegilops tauschii subsp. strangulata TaxID=200361 RepID=A0A453RM75_AEGTS